MKIPNSRNRDDVRDERSMTAMIDVVFLLLIFFVCASIGQMGELLVGAEMSAGSIDAADVLPQERPLGEVWLFVRRDDAGKTAVQLGEQGTVYRQQDGRATFRESADYDRLVTTLQSLAQAEATIPVILDIEKPVPMGDTLAVYTAVKTAGFENVNFATTPDEKTPEKQGRARE